MKQGIGLSSVAKPLRQRGRGGEIRVGCVSSVFWGSGLMLCITTLDQE